VEDSHRRIAQIALAAAGHYSLALAGGYAVQAHGIGQRPSGDVDLFLAWDRHGEFDHALDAVTDALARENFSVKLLMRGATFARLQVAAEDGQSPPEKLEISADWRAHEPVTMDIGPVLHRDDAVANKMAALYGRALPRDFLDIDAAITSGIYSHDQLLTLAEEADAGFDRALFADAVGALRQITDMAFGEYGVGPEEVFAMRQRFTSWRAELIAGGE
jgi:hypothetical protein